MTPTRDPRTKQPNKVRLGLNLLVRARPPFIQTATADPPPPPLVETGQSHGTPPPATNQSEAQPAHERADPGVSVRM